MASFRIRCFVVLLLVLITVASVLAVPVAREEHAPAKKGHGSPSTASNSPNRSRNKHKPSSIKLPLPARLKSKVATPKATSKVKGSSSSVKSKNKGKPLSSSAKGMSKPSKVSSKSSASKGQHDKNSNSRHKNGRKTSHVSKKDRKNRKGKKHHRDIDDTLEQHAPTTDNEGRSILNLDIGGGHEPVNLPAPYFVTSAHKILEAEPLTYPPPQRGQSSHAADVRVAPTVPGSKSPVIEHESHHVLDLNLRRDMSPLGTDDESSTEPRALIDLELGHQQRPYVAVDSADTPPEQLGVAQTAEPIAVPQAPPVVVEHIRPIVAAEPQPFNTTVATLYQSPDHDRPLLEVNVKREPDHDGHVQARGSGDPFVTHPSLIHMAGAKPNAAHAQSHNNGHPGEAVHGPFILHPSLINVGGGRVHTADEGVKNHARRQVKEHHKHNANDRPSLLDPLTKHGAAHGLASSLQRPADAPHPAHKRGEALNITTEDETCPDLNSAVPGFLQLVSPTDNPSAPEPLANLILSAGATPSSSFVLNASNDSHAVVQLIAIEPPNADGTITAKFVVQMLNPDVASMTCLCSSYNPKDMSPLTLLSCNAPEVSNSISQTFLYDPVTSYVQPMWPGDPDAGDDDKTEPAAEAKKNPAGKRSPPLPDTFMAQDGPAENIALPMPDFVTAALASPTAITKTAEAVTGQSSAASTVLGAVTGAASNAASTVGDLQHAVLIAFRPEVDVVKPGFLGVRDDGSVGGGDDVNTGSSSSSSTIDAAGSIETSTPSGAGGNGEDGSADNELSPVSDSPATGTATATAKELNATTSETSIITSATATTVAASEPTVAPEQVLKLTAVAPTPYAYRFVRATD